MFNRVRIGHAGLHCGWRRTFAGMTVEAKHPATGQPFK